VDEARDAALDFGADDHFLPRRERADDVHLAADVADLGRFDGDRPGFLAFGRLGAAAARTRSGTEKNDEDAAEGFHEKGYKYHGSMKFLWLLPILLLAGCTREPLPYPAQIEAWHAEKDRFMRESSESPVPADKRATFPGLAYFPTDPAYRVPAVLQPAQGAPAVEMPTSTGQRRKMRRVGNLTFMLNGQPLSLGAFVEADENDTRRLFVPFGDLTNALETYPGGRYLDLERTPTGVYDLDFNRAYHPFCLFNSSYDCPYPPQESRLKVPIRAGEKLPKPLLAR